MGVCNIFIQNKTFSQCKIKKIDAFHDFMHREAIPASSNEQLSETIEFFIRNMG